MQTRSIILLAMLAAIVGPLAPAALAQGETTSSGGWHNFTSQNPPGVVEVYIGECDRTTRTRVLKARGSFTVGNNDYKFETRTVAIPCNSKALFPFGFRPRCTPLPFPPTVPPGTPLPFPGYNPNTDDSATTVPATFFVIVIGIDAQGKGTTVKVPDTVTISEAIQLPIPIIDPVTGLPIGSLFVPVPKDSTIPVDITDPIRFGREKEPAPKQR